MNEDYINACEKIYNLLTIFAPHIKIYGGGFRIKALLGRPLKRNELVEIGCVVLDNEELVRKLISFGWDTLEVHANQGYNGTKCALKDFANIDGVLNANN